MTDDRLTKSLLGLTALVKRLRGPGGCPWDRQQTLSTVKIYLLEEAYEVLDAIERDSSRDVCQELGDLLFQIVFLASIAQEKDEFTLADVMEQITEKMIHRHPHVFGQETVNSPEEVSQNWEKIKDREQDYAKTTSSLLLHIPVHLPALLRAHRLSDRASKVGFDWETKEGIWEKVKEEFEELAKAIRNRAKDRIAEEIGDLFFSIVNLARHWGLNAEHLLRDANQKFIDRFREMEHELKSMGLDLEKATPSEMNKIWDTIKRNRD